jgi:MFS family permease
MEKKGLMAQIAILSLSFISAGASAVNPALQGLAGAYPDLPFTSILLVATLPTLMYIPFSIIAGAVAGSKIKFRTLALLGAVLWVVGGLAPLVFRNFTAILAARVLFGIGLGIVSPLASALILRLFDGKQRASLMGFGSAMMNAGGIVFMLLGGVLAATFVHNVWFDYLFGVVALLLLVLWLPEPAKIEKVQSGVKTSMPMGVWVYVFLMFLFTTLMYPMLLSMSTLIVKGGLGTAAAAGLVLSLFTGGGFLSSLVYGKVSSKVGRFSLALSLALFAIGIGLIATSASLAVVIVGAVIAGFGSGIQFPAIMMLMGKVAPPAVISGAVGLALAGNKLAGFLSPYWMSLLAKVSGNSAVQFPLIVGSVGFAVLAVVLALVNAKPAAAPRAQVA